MGTLKMTFGRKFFAGLFGVIVLLAILFVAMAVCPDAINPGVLVTAMLLVFLLVILYISSNVFTTFIKSRWFQADLVGR